MPKTVLAERLGISRRTIYHWIETGQLDRDLDQEPVSYRPRPPVPRKDRPLQGDHRQPSGGVPQAQCSPSLPGDPGSRLHGCYTQVKEFVRQVRPWPPEEPLIRFETPPGHQAQVDLAHFRFPWGRRYGLLVVLGYSRLLWLRFYARQVMRTLFGGLDEAFRFFGAVPREILFDQIRSVVVADHRDRGGPLMENLEFLRFAHHWGFKPRVCRPKMPGALESLDTVLAGVDGGQFTPPEAIEKRLGARITLRKNRRLQAAMRSSRLPAVKTLEDFDFSFQPSVKREQSEL